MYNILYMLSTVVNPPSGSTSTTADAAASTTQTGGLFGNSTTLLILYFIAIIGIFYFLSIRPQKKREASASQMRDSIKPGDSVVLISGLYGNVVDVTAECFIIEFGMNKGVRIPVLKAAVSAVKEPNLTDKPIEPPVYEKKSLFGKMLKSKNSDDNNN
ncbi:MAG: preprotein translocase subunit YajC [Lachnospiraceae bacterium]|nr:preprotein translocase subunit YajC [Lachnospiraceae bacterium]